MPERLHSTNGGSSDTELNEFTVMPTGSPRVFSPVTTVTPVAKWPSALRKKAASKAANGVETKVVMIKDRLHAAPTNGTGTDSPADRAPAMHVHSGVRSRSAACNGELEKVIAAASGRAAASQLPYRRRSHRSTAGFEEKHRSTSGSRYE